MTSRSIALIFTMLSLTFYQIGHIKLTKHTKPFIACLKMKNWQQSLCPQRSEYDV